MGPGRQYCCRRDYGDAAIALVGTREPYRKERRVLAAREAIDPGDQLLGYIVELLAGWRVVQLRAREVEPVAVLPYLDVPGGKQGGEVLQIVPVAVQPCLGCHPGKDSHPALTVPAVTSRLTLAPGTIQRPVDIPECPAGSGGDVPRCR
jgi:hypothetical protein